MKKHIIGILIVTAILVCSAVGVWFVINQRNAKPLYKVSCEFASSADTNNLLLNISQAEQLYQEKTSPSETRLTTLKGIIEKIDGFEADLNSYLLLSNIKASSTNKISKSYKSLSGTRGVLIKDYNEYITRMTGNTNIDGNALQNLYNDIFDKTVDYIHKYNSCFKSTYNHVFNKVYKCDTIKQELYSLYNAGVNNLLNNISNSHFNNTTTIQRLNKGVVLVSDNLYIKTSVQGGEFSAEALNFKKHFNNSNLNLLIENFETYFNASVNINTETSSEKLAIYYAKQIINLEI